MMNKPLLAHLRNEIEAIQAAGTTKRERVIASRQGAWIVLADGRRALNMCANNYLGLAGDDMLVAAAKQGLDDWGFGLSSVRFICGTQTLHKTLEKTVSDFLGTDDTILYSSCFDANGGLFETLLGAEDAVISDSLNHASIIDGIRLCKAKRFRYANNDMEDLEAQLKAADSDGARFKLIATDGVFSMDGTIANIGAVCDLADRYNASVMVDDSHALGVIGKTGRGSAEHCGALGRVDVFTGTFGKALGGASGGFTTGKKEIIEILRNRSRPYLFSNTLAPAVAAATIKAFEILSTSSDRLARLQSNAQTFRSAMRSAGFNIPVGTHPIVPILLGDAKKANEMAAMLLDEGVYVIGFSFPVVPKDKARIRVQLSAAHTAEDVEYAIERFKRVGKKIGVI